MDARDFAKQQAACHIERGVIATLWQDLNLLLTSCSEVVDESVWLLMESLPSVDDLDTQQLPQLAQLHVSSAAGLMKTVRLIAPSAFCAGGDSPDELLLSRLNEGARNVVASLVELQLFHLQRAALLSAQHRRCVKLQLRTTDTPGALCSTCCSSSAGPASCGSH